MSPRAEAGDFAQQPRVRSIGGKPAPPDYSTALGELAARLRAGLPVSFVYDDFSAFDIDITPHAGGLALSVKYHGTVTRLALAVVPWARGSSSASRRLLGAFELRRGHDRDTVARVLTDLDAALAHAHDRDAA